MHREIRAKCLVRLPCDEQNGLGHARYCAPVPVRELKRDVHEIALARGKPVLGRHVCC